MQGSRWNHRRMIGASWVAALLLAACGGDSGSDATNVSAAPPVVESTPGTGTGQPLRLTLLHINDHHSTLAESPKTLDLALDPAPGAAATKVTVSSAGFARVTTAIRQLAADRPDVLKLHAGDAMTGTLYFNQAGEPGQADAALMNTVCFDAFTLGNHEFDKGDAGLKGFLDFLRAGDCRTPVLSANVAFGQNSALHPSRAPDAVRRSVVVQRGGQSIGLVGLTIAGKTKASSSPDPDTTFEDEVTAAQREIDALRGQGVERIIVMSHIGYGFDLLLAQMLSGVDVIVGGDSHSLLGPATLTTLGVGSPAGDYPTRTTDLDGRPVCIVQAWEYAQVVGELTVDFDAAGQVTACQGRPHVLIGTDYQIAGSAVSDSQRSAIDAAVAATDGLLYPVEADAAAVAVLAPFTERVQTFTTTRVAVATEEVCSRRVPGGEGSVDYSRSSAACNALGKVSARGGDIQQLVAQAYLEVARRDYGGADIALQSGGGARIPLLPGPVTAAQVMQVLPFGNRLFRLDITGAEARSMIEEGIEAVYGPGGTTGPYPYTGGMRFDVDARLPAGSRVSNVEVRNAESGIWEVLDLARTYRLFVLSFNATGGDGYTTLAAVPPERRLDIGVLDVDAFLQYVQSLPVDPASGLPAISRLPDESYSTRTFIGP